MADAMPAIVTRDTPQPADVKLPAEQAAAEEADRAEGERLDSLMLSVQKSFGLRIWASSAGLMLDMVLRVPLLVTVDFLMFGNEFHDFATLAKRVLVLMVVFLESTILCRLLVILLTKMYKLPADQLNVPRAWQGLARFYYWAGAFSIVSLCLHGFLATRLSDESSGPMLPIDAAVAALVLQVVIGLVLALNCMKLCSMLWCCYRCRLLDKKAQALDIEQQAWREKVISAKLRKLKEAEFGSLRAVCRCSECVICMESLKDDTVVCRLACGHAFHPGCVKKWFKENFGSFQCPMRCEGDPLEDTFEADVAAAAAAEGTWHLTDSPGAPPSTTIEESGPEMEVSPDDLNDRPISPINSSKIVWTEKRFDHDQHPEDDQFRVGAVDAMQSPQAELDLEYARELAEYARDVVEMEIPPDGGPASTSSLRKGAEAQSAESDCVEGFLGRAIVRQSLTKIDL